MATLIGKVSRQPAGLLQVSGFASLVAAAGVTFGLGAGLAACGVACVLAAWLVEKS